MHYFLWVRLEGFYVRETMRLESGLDQSPLVVHKSGIVLDVSPEALARGVSPGLPLSQAKALLSGARFITHDPDRFTAAQTAWLDLLTPFSGVIEPRDQHEAALDLSDHPQPKHIASHIANALQAHGFKASCGAGCSKWLARLAADVNDLNETAVTDPAHFLAPLPIHRLLPVSRFALAKLEALGYGTIGQAQAVPSALLLRQFGNEGLTIARAAIGRLHEPVAPVYPERSLSAQFTFEGGTNSLEAVMAGCAALAEQLGSALAATEQEGSELVIHVLHDAHTITLARTFARPFTDERMLRRFLALLIGDGFKEPVHALRVSLLRLKRVKHVQTSLFSAQSADAKRSLERTLAQLRRKFGETSVRFAGDVRLPRRVQVLREWNGIVGWI